MTEVHEILVQTRQTNKKKSHNFMMMQGNLCIYYQMLPVIVLAFLFFQFLTSEFLSNQAATSTNLN